MPTKYFSIAILVAFLSINSDSFAQVGIGITSPNANAMLDVTAPDKGFLPPRMTTAERNDLGGLLLASSLPEDKGMLVFDTALTTYYYWDGAAWVAIAAAGGGYVDLTTNQTVAGMKTFSGDLTPAGRLMLPMGEISYFNYSGFDVNFTLATTAGSSGTNNMVKINPPTGTNFVNDGFAGDVDFTNTNRLTYRGAATRYFHIALSFSYTGNNGDIIVFGVAKNGDVKDSSKMFITTGGSVAFNSTALHVLLSLAKDEYIEFFVGNTSDNDPVKIRSFNFVAIGM